MVDNSDTRTFARADRVICTDAEGGRLAGVVRRIFRNGSVLVDVGRRGTREWLPDARMFDAGKVTKA